MSSTSYQSAHSSPSHCYCGIPVAKRQSWTSSNPGRRFVLCKFANPHTEFKGCKFWHWVDEEQQDWQRALINQLILEKKLLKKDKELLKNEVVNLEDQKSNLMVDLEKMRKKCKEIGQKKCKGKRRNESFKIAAYNWLFVMVVAVIFIAFFLFY